MPEHSAKVNNGEWTWLCNAFEDCACLATWNVEEFEQKLTKNIHGSLRQVNARCLEDEEACHPSDMDNARTKEACVG